MTMRVRAALLMVLIVRPAGLLADVHTDFVIKNAEIRDCFDEKQPEQPRLANFTILSSLTLDPDQSVEFYNRAIANGRLGHRKEAAEDRRRALALDPDLIKAEAPLRGR